MDFVHHLISEELIHAFGWTVVHSLWQAALVAFVLGLAQIVLGRLSSHWRYLLANGALLAVLGLAVTTFCYLYRPVSGSSELLGALAIGEGGSTTVGEGADFSLSVFTAYFNEHLPLIVSLWLIGVLLFLLRTLGGLLYVQRLKTRYVQPLPAIWQDRMQELASRLSLKRPVQLLESAQAGAPMVIGYLKPVILLPVGALAGLTPQQVEAILAHELAHIFRNDYLFNLIQSFVETLFYFNPAVWWISANIRTERENCCDDIAVELCGNSLVYAKALVSLQEMSRAAPALAMPFSSRQSRLLERVRRILKQSKNKSNTMEKLTVTAMLLVALAVLLVSAGSPTDPDPDYEGILPGVPALEWRSDTLPDGTERRRIVKREDGNSVELTLENGEVRELKVDGETIPPDRYEEYSEMTDDLIEELKQLPTPPSPPAPPEAPEPPDAPEPPLPPDVPEPPLPPDPPFHFRKSTQISTEKSEDGATIIRIQEGKETREIRVPAGSANVIVDGYTIEPGEEAIILDENYFGSDHPFKVWAMPDGQYGYLFGGDDLAFGRAGISADEPARLLEEVRREREHHLRQLELNEVQLHQQLGRHQLQLTEEEAARREELSKQQEVLSRQYEEALRAFEKAKLRDSQEAERMQLRVEALQRELEERAARLEDLHGHQLRGQLQLMEVPDASARFFAPQMLEVVPQVEPGVFFHTDGIGFFDSNVKGAFERQLRRDGHLQSGRSYTLELTGKKLWINGEKQSEEVYEKYRRIYEEATGVDLSRKSRIEIAQ